MTASIRFIPFILTLCMLCAGMTCFAGGRARAQQGCTPEECGACFYTLSPNVTTMPDRLKVFEVQLIGPEQTLSVNDVQIKDNVGVAVNTTITTIDDGRVEITLEESLIAGQSYKLELTNHCGGGAEPIVYSMDVFETGELPESLGTLSAGDFLVDTGANYLFDLTLEPTDAISKWNPWLKFELYSHDTLVPGGNSLGKYLSQSIYVDCFTDNEDLLQPGEHTLQLRAHLSGDAQTIVSDTVNVNLVCEQAEEVLDFAPPPGEGPPLAGPDDSSGGCSLAGQNTTTIERRTGAVAVFLGTAAAAMSLAEPMEKESGSWPQGAGIIVALGWFLFAVIWQASRHKFPTFARSFGIAGLVLFIVQLMDLLDIAI